MDQPQIAAKQPAALNLEPGTYYWCACGRSSTQPFCDGSHKGSSFSPKPVEIKEKQTVYLCQCKRSGNAPYCDGSHSKL